MSDEFTAEGGRERALPAEERAQPRDHVGDGVRAERDRAAQREPVDGATNGANEAMKRAREALAQAKADARKRGSVPGSRRRTGPRPTRERGRGGDPRAFGSAIRDLLADRGWEQRAAIGGVFGDWPRIVGRELAEHTRPDRFEDGELVVVADSTAWATQLRLLAATLVRRLNEELGDGTVRRVKVLGPASAPRRRGAWRVR